MKNFPNFAIAFLRIILWISLISATIGIIVTLLGLITVILDLNIPLLSNVNFTISGVAIKFEELKKTGLFSFVVFGILTVCYLYLFIRLTNNALNVLYKVDFQNPFNEEISNLISKLGSTALVLGILNIVFGSVVSLLYHGELVLDFSFEDFNFLIIAAIIYIISIIFKRGIELQSENDLTI